MAYRYRNCLSGSEQQLEPRALLANGYLMPQDGKTLLLVGQDVTAMREYNAAVGGEQTGGAFGGAASPAAAGYSGYVSFFDVLEDGTGDGLNNGGLGITSDGTPRNDLVSWGGGMMNALLTAQENPTSALQLGLNIADGNRIRTEKLGWETWGDLQGIGEGQYDAQIQQLAQFFKMIPDTPVYLRIGYELDGYWNTGYENTENFKLAWQRIVDGLRAEGVNNVAFVWQLSTSPIDDILEQGQEENVEDWYPGDEYVDWIGASWFLELDEKPTVAQDFPVRTQREFLEEALAFARQHDKPVMIAESAYQGYDAIEGTQSNFDTLWDGKPGEGTVEISGPEAYQRWYQPYFEYIRENSDVIKAVTYISADWGTQWLFNDTPFPGHPDGYIEGYWGDTRVQANEFVFSKWKEEIGDTTFWQLADERLSEKVGLQGPAVPEQPV